MADIRCPVCGKMNPEDAQICQFCFGLLKQDEEDQPDWLARIREKSKQDQEGTPDLPDWLRDDPAPAVAAGTGGENSNQSGPGNMPAEPAPASPQGAKPDDDETPEWLRKLRSQPADEASPAEDESPLPPDSEMMDLPSWLKELSAPSVEPPAPPSPAAPDEEKTKPVAESPVASSPVVPPPLQNEPAPEKSTSAFTLWPLATDINPENVTSSSSQDNPPPAEDALPPSTATPQWLSGLTFDEPALSNPSPGESSGGKESLTPDWLANFNTEFSENQAPEEQPAAIEPGVLPDWLAQVKAETDKSVSPAPAAPSSVFLEDPNLPITPDQTSPFSMEDMPDWLARMSPPEESVLTEPVEAPPVKEPEKEKTEEITLASADLPTWVQAMRPIESATPATPVLVDDDDRVESVGPLAGLRGILPAEILTSEVRKPPAYPVNLQVTDKQRINAALFESILSAELKPQPTSRPRSFPSQRVLRIVVAVILILAVWLPIWGGSQVMPLPGYAPAEVTALQKAIYGLAPDSTILLAVDYEPALAGEVDAVASGVVSHLMSRSTNIILISTNPMGPVFAEQLLSRAQVSQPGYDIASKTLNLGYLAGGPSGLFNFSIQPQQAAPLTVDQKNAWDQPLLKGKSLTDFAGVFVLTESADTARTWVEQVKPALGSVPLFMVTSAQVAPMIRPYYDANQVQGFVSGLSGGAIYEQSSGASGLSTSYWDAYQVGILIAIGLLAIGVLIFLGNILFSRRKFGEGDKP